MGRRSPHDKAGLVGVAATKGGVVGPEGVDFVSVSVKLAPGRPGIDSGAKLHVNQCLAS